MGRDRKRLRRLRPRIMPSRNQKRLGMPLMKTFKGGNHEILPLAVLQLAAGKHRESVTKPIGFLAGIKEGRIDPLGTIKNVR